AELGEALGEVQRAGPADVVALEVGEFLEEGRIVLGLFVLGRQIVDQRHQGFGDVLAAKATEQAAVIRAVAVGLCGCGHEGVPGLNGGCRAVYDWTAASENR